MDPGFPSPVLHCYTSCAAHMFDLIVSRESAQAKHTRSQRRRWELDIKEKG